MSMWMAAKQLKELAITLDEGFHSAIEKKSRLVICKGTKRAHSQPCYITEVSWNKDKNGWKVNTRFA